MQNSTLAPVVLFVYNRPQHTLRTLEALCDNPLARETELYIYADGPKGNSTPEQLQKMAEVRSVIRSKQWCGDVHIIEQERNKGLAPSVIQGVTEVVNRHGKVIVIEDDLVMAPYFLAYMNDGLNEYERETDVISIHGYVYPVKKKLPNTFFIKGADCWGWATWKRGWDIFNADGASLLSEIKARRLEKEFNFNNTYDYTGMLEGQIAGKVSSWAIRWYASAFLADKLTLYPGTSIVQNTGFDGSGTHCGETTEYTVPEFPHEYSFAKIPIKESRYARKVFENYFSPQPQRTIQKVKKLIKVMVSKCRIR